MKQKGVFMDLVILAAGLGNRFGGDKQFKAVDEDGNFILDYSVHDAVKAGFDRVILIIRPEHQKIFDEVFGKRLRSVCPVLYAFQEMKNVPKRTVIPPERTKPWGTAHALYACKDIISDKFAVIGADDFYGYNSFEVLANFLKKSKPGQYACVGYTLQSTLSKQGAVKRGILLQKGNMVKGIVESRVEERDGKVFATPLNEENWKEMPSGTKASMLMFGFGKDLMKGISKDLKQFFSQSQERLKTDEALLPEMVQGMLNENTTMEILPTKSIWHGITYKEELSGLADAIKDMKARGEYPQHLYPLVKEK